MIELTAETQTTLETLDELFEALSRLIGRTLMVHYPSQEVDDYVGTIPAAKVVGELKWLKLQEGGMAIEVFLGKPPIAPIEKYPQLPTVGLNLKISVLTAEVWTVVHEPAARQK